jgi:hemolysin III
MEKNYSKSEDIANSITHFLGAGLSIAAIAILAYRGAKLGNAKHVIGFVVFGISLLLLFFSCFNFMVQRYFERNFLEIFVHRTAVFLD